MASIDENDIELLNPESDLELLPMKSSAEVKTAEARPAQPSLKTNEQLAAQNPPTVLSSLVHGVTNGLTYNYGDEAASVVDPEASARFKASKEANPLTYALANVTGAILSPNPVGKIAALKNAGTLIKTAVAGGKYAAETALSSAGESDKKGLDRLDDVKETLTNPLVLGLGAASTAAPGLLSLTKKGADWIAKNGKQSYKLGTEMQDALSSDLGQEAVATAVNNFETKALAKVDESLKALSPAMDEIAAANVGTKVNMKPGLQSFWDFSKSYSPVKQADKDAYEIASTFLKKAEPELLKNAGSKLDASGLVLQKATSEAAEFSDAWNFKKALGELIFDPKNGESRALNESPKIKAKLISLYDNVSKGMGEADKTGTFKDLSKGYSALYKTYDGIDDLGSSLSKGSDKLNLTFNKRNNEIKKAFSEVPQILRSKVADLEQMLSVEMPEVYNAYNIAQKISGKSPASQTFLGQVGNMVSKVPLVGEGSRLQMLNRLGQESSGSAAPLISQGMQQLPAQAGRGLSTLLTPDGEPQ